MKRVVFIITLALIVLGFSSCTKDGVLSGTKWLGGERGSAMELRFTKNDFELQEIYLNEVFAGRYVYEAPNITFIVTSHRDASGKTQYVGGSFTGVVNGKVITLDMKGDKVLFIKQ